MAAPLVPGNLTRSARRTSERSRGGAAGRGALAGGPGAARRHPRERLRGVRPAGAGRVRPTLNQALAGILDLYYDFVGEYDAGCAPARPAGGAIAIGQITARAPNMPVVVDGLGSRRGQTICDLRGRATALARRGPHIRWCWTPISHSPVAAGAALAYRLPTVAARGRGQVPDQCRRRSKPSAQVVGVAGQGSTTVRPRPAAPGAGAV